MKCFVLFLMCVCNVFAKSSFSVEDSLLRKIDSKHDVLFLTFGGLAHQVGFARFEFVKMLSKYNVSSLYVRDIQQAYYQFGIESGGNITGTLSILKEELRIANPKAIIVFGNSSGGYAALLFGFLLQMHGFPIKEVHSFVPRIALAPHFLSYPGIEPEFFDLSELFAKYPTPKCRFDLYYALDSLDDTNAASAFNRYQWIRHHRYGKGGHGLAKRLRDEGYLLQIIEQSIDRVKRELDSSCVERNH